MKQAVWHEPVVVPSAAMSLHRDGLLSTLLYQRGMRDASDVARFLLRHPSAAPDPFHVPGMEEAVERVGQAIQAREKIGIFGDYDVDGMTSTALLVHALQGAGALALKTRLPTRAEGYGLNQQAIDEFVDDGTRLLIAVDCASTDHHHVAYALSRGLDVVILDHHQMPDGDAGPTGAITVSAQRLADPAAPARDLVAVGLAYLLASALAQEGYPLADGSPETDLQDLVALGTIADVAPLGGINRPLVRDGIEVLQKRPRPGILALCRVSDVLPANVDAEAVSFRLAPRLNSAGRMADPALALDLLLADDDKAANRLAAELDALNSNRRIETDRLTGEAEELLIRDPNGLN
ncbi:MAG: DHH family phosphoesterase, partial [Thermomicrobiales bacterium]